MSAAILSVLLGVTALAISITSAVPFFVYSAFLATVVIALSRVVQMKRTPTLSQQRLTNALLFAGCILALVSVVVQLSAGN